MAQNHNADYSEKPMTTYGRTQGPSRRYRRLRHPTFPAAEWTAKNPLLQRGEIGIESDTHKIKIGDGITYWNNLAYSQDDGQPKSTADYNMGNTSGGWTAMSTAQQDALNSGATTTNITQIGTNTTAIGNHIANTSNPHNVTASQVGLGNVDNTSDADKPISTATQDALDLKANIADLGTAAYTDSTDYATAAQGTKADSALQPGDNVSDLVNDAGYLTQHQTLADLGITATASEINVLDGITASTTELNYVDGVTSNIQTQIDGKQPKSTSAYNMGNTSGGWTAMSTAQQDALNSGANTTNIGQIATNTSNIADEIINRQNADNGLQSQIDAIVSKSDVVDIVGTYAELQAYDTSSLGNNDVVKVISDSTHNNAPSYYRWVITGGVGAWVYIGSESETYTKAETDALLNAKQDNITATDGITLTGTTLTNSGVRAVASGTANGTISVNTNGTSADVAVTGLGSAAYTSSSDYATSAQGTKADTAVQLGDLSTVATTGDYDDLLNKPTIPAAQVNSDWNAISGVAQILNKPTIPTVNDPTITVTQNGVSVGSFTLNQASGDTIALTDTTYSVMTGATAGDAGASGLVPAPAAGDQAKFLQGDGTWANPTAATAWGNITGTLSDQTDLQNALDAKANTDMNNLTSTGANIGNWSSNVTNCITEIPQDIKLELNAGTLALKAGSKVYVPNGFEADGVTRKFDIITIANDLTYSQTWGTAEQLMITVDSTGTSLTRTALNRCTSGTTAPTQTNYRFWYDTTNNLIKEYTSGAWTNTTVSFPIAIVTVPGDNTATVNSIDQVFNGLGYIGTAVFMLPGISALIPNGLNPDGSCKNIALTNPSVYVYDNPTTVERNVGLITDSTGTIINYENASTSNTFVGLAQNRPSTVANTNNNYWYSTDENQWYNTSGSTTANWQKAYPVFLGKRNGTATSTTYFEQKSAFSAVGRDDREFFAHQAMPSDKYVDLTLGATGTSYTAPADGYFLLNKTPGAASKYIQMTGASGISTTATSYNTTLWTRIFLPAKKGDTVSVYYDFTGTTNYFRFIYANGAK